MASLITYADIGSVKNLKSEEALTLVGKFNDENALNQVLCRRAKGSVADNIESALPELAYWALGGLQMTLGISKRRWEEAIFDYIASIRLQPTDVVFFHPARFTRSIKKAEKLKAITVGLATTAHPHFNNQLKAEERARLSGDHASKSPPQDNPVYNNFNYLIAFSEFAKKTCVDNGIDERRVFVAEPDIDTERFSPNDKIGSSRFTVVFPAASTSILKGLQYLLKAWEGVDIPNKELIVLGKRSGWPKKADRRIESQIRQDTSIRTPGIVDNPETYFQNADVVVYPSLTEGFGRASLEAMACGTPVVVTENACGIVEDEQTGFVVPIRDPEALREKIRYLYNHESKRKEMGEKAIQAVEEKPSFANRMYQIYKEILKKEIDDR